MEPSQKEIIAAMDAAESAIKAAFAAAGRPLGKGQGSYRENRRIDGVDFGLSVANRGQGTIGVEIILGRRSERKYDVKALGKLVADVLAYVDKGVAENAERAERSTARERGRVLADRINADLGIAYNDSLGRVGATVRDGGQLAVHIRADVTEAQAREILALAVKLGLAVVRTDMVR